MKEALRPAAEAPDVRWMKGDLMVSIRRPLSPRKGPVRVGSIVTTLEGDVITVGKTASPSSPLGSALLGKFERDSATYTLPSGETRTIIIKRIE